MIRLIAACARAVRVEIGVANAASAAAIIFLRSIIAPPVSAAILIYRPKPLRPLLNKAL